jgi:hypothetical protein
MRLGDILYFAPGIRFDGVDVDGPRLPEQFKRRMVGFYLEPARECTRLSFAFAAGVLLVSCVDALARLRFGDGVGKRFKKFAAEELQSLSGGDVAERLYDEFRNGLVHEARLKKELADKALATTDSKDLFGTREELGADYIMRRSLGAMLGIYGNSKVEAAY